MKLLIVTTVFNGKDELKLTLDSLIKQVPHEKIYHLILNDGSTENLDPIIYSYKEKVQKTIDVIYNKLPNNVGVDKAHEIAFNLSKKYNHTHFTWLDAGDFYSENYIISIQQLLAKYPNFDWYHNDSYMYIKKENKIVLKGKYSSNYNKRKLTRINQTINILFHDNFHYGNFIINRSFFETFNGQYKILENSEHYDYQFFIEMIVCNAKMKYLFKPLSYIYECSNHAGGIKRKNSSLLLKDYEQFLNKNQKIYFKELLSFKNEVLHFKEAKIFKDRKNDFKQSYIAIKKFIKGNRQNKIDFSLFKILIKYFLLF